MNLVSVDIADDKDEVAIATTSLALPVAIV